MATEYGFEILHSAEAATALSVRQGKRTPGEFIEGARQMYVLTPILARMRQVARQVEPFDREEGFDEKMPLGSAFFRGSLPAVHLAHYYLSPVQRLAMMNYDFGIEIGSHPRDPGFGDIHDASNADHMLLAQEGWKLAETNIGGKYSEWAGKMYVDAARQEYFRAGYGFVVQWAMATDNEMKRNEIEALVKQGTKIPWEAGWAELGVQPDQG